MREKVILTLLTLGTAAVLVAGIHSCAASLSSENSGETIVKAEWRPMQPPRSGLRCWYSDLPAHGVSYCEPDPSATFGAGAR